MGRLAAVGMHPILDTWESNFGREKKKNHLSSKCENKNHSILSRLHAKDGNFHIPASQVGITITETWNEFFAFLVFFLFFCFFFFRRYHDTECVGYYGQNRMCEMIISSFVSSCMCQPSPITINSFAAFSLSHSDPLLCECLVWTCKTIFLASTVGYAVVMCVVAMPWRAMLDSRLSDTVFGIHLTKWWCDVEPSKLHLRSLFLCCATPFYQTTVCRSTAPPTAARYYRW